MSIINILIIFFSMLGLFGVALILNGLFFLLWDWLKVRMIRKNIPEKIRKEVEDERTKKELARAEAGRKYRDEEIRDRESEAYRESGRISDGRDSNESDAIQPIDDSENREDNKQDREPERRDKSDWFSPIK